MLKIVITQDVLDWLCDELGWDEASAEEFAQTFIGLLQAQGGLTPAAPDPPAAVESAGDSEESAGG